MDAADGRIEAGVMEWLFVEVLLDVRSKLADQSSSSNRPIRDLHRTGQSSGGLWQS